MKRRTIGAFVSAVAALISIEALADSQARGVPSLADQVQALQVVVQTLQIQNQTLQNQLQTFQTTVVNLQTTNSGLQSALDAETTARVAADNALQTALAASAQSGGDVFVAQGGDSGLMSNLDPSIVVSVNVPAGSYLIHAVVPVMNMDPNKQSGDCVLSIDPNAFIEQPSGVHAQIIDLPSFASERVPLIGTQTFSAATPIAVLCKGRNWESQGATIDAVKIHSIN